MTNLMRLLYFASIIALVAGPALYAEPAAAALITFDDLSDNGNGTPIANGYQGLNWTNWDVLNTPLFTANVGPNGAAAGTVSAPNIGFNGFGDLAIFSNSAFTLVSADLTAFWRDNLQATFTGKLAGVTIDTVTLSLSATAPTLEIFNWAGIDEVDLSATGGTQHTAYSGDGTEVAVDDLTLTTSQVPEPSSLVIIAGALAFLGLACRRRKAA